MRNLIRSPLTWMVAAEVLVVTLLAIVAWTMVANAARTVVVSPSIEMPESAPDAAPGLPDFPVSLPPAARGPLPGLNLDSSFWRARLVQLNREQSFLAGSSGVSSTERWTRCSATSKRWSCPRSSVPKGAVVKSRRSPRFRRDRARREGRALA